MIGEGQVTYQVLRENIWFYFFIFQQWLTKKKKKKKKIWHHLTYIKYIHLPDMYSAKICFLALGMLSGEAKAKMERQKDKIKRQASEIQSRLRWHRMKNLKSQKIVNHRSDMNPFSLFFPDPPLLHLLLSFSHPSCSHGKLSLLSFLGKALALPRTLPGSPTLVLSAIQDQQGNASALVIRCWRGFLSAEILES